MPTINQKIDRDEIMKKWRDYDLCPDFEPVLEDLLDKVQDKEEALSNLKNAVELLDEVWVFVTNNTTSTIPQWNLNKDKFMAVREILTTLQENK